MLQLPVRITAADDLRRSRLAGFFRLLLALPHLVWLSLWSLEAYVLYLFVAIAAVINGALPGWAHAFYAAYTRYVLHLGAYLTFAANPYPGFIGEPGTYPIDAAFDEPQPQNRWSLAFRWLLAIPALLLASTMGAIGLWSSVGILTVIPLLGWFVCLARGAMPQGFRDATVFGLGYTTQAYAYFFLLSPRYPSADPVTVPVAEAPAQPVRLAVADDLQRSRMTVFFRLLLALPHFLWVALWGIAAELAALVGWVIALFTAQL